jgi:hypothetical protein
MIFTGYFLMFQMAILWIISVNYIPISDFD